MCADVLPPRLPSFAGRHVRAPSEGGRACPRRNASQLVLAFYHPLTRELRGSMTRPIDWKCSCCRARHINYEPGQGSNYSNYCGPCQRKLLPCCQGVPGLGHSLRILRADAEEIAVGLRTCGGRNRQVALHCLGTTKSQERSTTASAVCRGRHRAAEVAMSLQTHRGKHRLRCDRCPERTHESTTIAGLERTATGAGWSVRRAPEPASAAGRDAR